MNQVYVGVFRRIPMRCALARNLSSTVASCKPAAYADADDTSHNSAPGSSLSCARSFWTPPTDELDTYWAFRPQGGCLAVANSDPSNTPDGNIVEKGGQAYRLRTSVTRTMRTCSPTFASCTTLTDFEVANTAITDTLLGAASAAERDLLIDWQRGQDLDDEDVDAVTSTEMRPSSHGDVLHSRRSPSTRPDHCAGRRDLLRR